MKDKPSLEMYQALLTYSLDLIAILDADGLYRYVSPSCERLLGHVPEALLGSSHLDSLDPQDVLLATERFGQVLRADNSVVSCPLRFKCADGSLRLMETTVMNHLADPFIAGIIVIGRESAPDRSMLGEMSDQARLERERADLIVSQREAQAELVSERRRLRDLSLQVVVERDRLRQVLDVLPAAVMIADMTPEFVISNRAARDILGVEATGRAVPSRGDNHSETFAAWRLDGTPYPAEELPLERALFGGETVNGDQFLVHNAVTGRDVPVLANAAPLQDVDGTITGAIIVFQDTTAIKELDRTREEFLSSAAHDLKTPLASVRGYSQLARRRLDRLAAPEAKGVSAQLLQIEAATTRMLGLINELVDVAHVQMGVELDLERHPHDLVSLVRRTIAQQQGLTGHRIVFDPAVSSLEALVDEARMERVIANLLSNAIKYSSQESTINVRVGLEERDPPLAVIHVEDHGQGIPTDDLPHIFDRFRRASNVVGRIQGTGIGLASVRQIVEEHGGSVTVRSEEGEGSTFTVWLPIAST